MHFLVVIWSLQSIENNKMYIVNILISLKPFLDKQIHQRCPTLVMDIYQPTHFRCIPAPTHINQIPSLHHQ